jgi:hypothetical protein
MNDFNEKLAAEAIEHTKFEDLQQSIDNLLLNLDEMVAEKIIDLRSHLNERLAKLEGMLSMLASTRPQQASAPQVQAPAQPAAPSTQVPVHSIKAQEPMYSIQNGAYAGWWCRYTDDKRAHPVLSREQAPAWESLFGTRGNNPTMLRADVIAWEAHNASAIEQMREKAREWAQSQTGAPAQAPAAPSAPPVPSGFEAPPFDDKIPDFV